MNLAKIPRPAVRAVLALSAVCSALCAVPGWAQLYNIDSNAGTSPTYTGAAVLGAAGDLWNGYQNGSWVGSPTYVSIFDSTGSSAAGVQFAAWNNSGESYWTTGTTANPSDLMSDYLEAPGWGAADGWPIKAELTGLPALMPFQLVVFSAGNTAGQGAAITLFDPSGNIVKNTSAADRDIAGGAGDAYQVFDGTTTANGTVYFEVKTLTDDWHSLNGLQLQLVPEPSTMALGFLGLVVLNRFRRVVR